MKYSAIKFFLLTLILAAGLPSIACESTITIPMRDLENLSIVDNGRSATLEKALNTCLTNAGKRYFSQSLQQLSTNISNLCERQKVLKKLSESPQELVALEEFLTICGKTEKSIDIFATKTPATLDEFYFKRSRFQSLNDKPTALTSTFFLHYVHLFAPLIEHALLHAGIDSLFSKFTNNHGHDHDHHHHHGCGCSHGHGFSKTDLMYYLIQGAHWGLHIPGYYEIITHMQTRRAKIIAAQQEIAELKTYLEAVHKLYDHASQLHAEFVAQQAPTLQRMFALTSEHDEAKEMVTAVIQTSWDSSLQNSLMPGTILATHATLKKNAHILQTITQEIGIIDAFTRVARLVANQTDKNPYCFVTFVQSAQPTIELNHLWHHAIDATAMRPLTISIGNNNSCMLVQGANGSGKSTMLTALGHALFLAQSWGIAPAASATISPFACIHTHSLKRDAIEQGLSHFYYEHAYYESMFKKDGKGLSIALLDEPYTCTDPKTGTQYLSDLIGRIQDASTKAAIITTHYAL